METKFRFAPLAAATLLLFSCQKHSTGPTAGNNDLFIAASSLGGQLSTGPVFVEKDGEEIGITYENGNKYLIITTIAGTQMSDLTAITAARIVTSPYGIVLEDAHTGKTFFLVNNDAASASKFKHIQPAFHSPVENDPIFGTELVNAGKG